MFQFCQGKRKLHKGNFLWMRGKGMRTRKKYKYSDIKVDRLYVIKNEKKIFFCLK